MQLLTDNSLVIHNDDGVMYVTTRTVNENGQTVTETRTVQRNAISQATTTTQPIQQTSILPPEGFALSVGGLIQGVLSLVLVIAAMLVFFYLILGGIEWITSGGDKGKTESARQKIMSAIIGLIIVAASYAILTLALNFLGFASLNDVFQSTGTVQGIPSPTPQAETELGEVIQATPSAR